MEIGLNGKSEFRNNVEMLSKRGRLHGAENYLNNNLKEIKEEIETSSCFFAYRYIKGVLSEENIANVCELISIKVPGFQCYYQKGQNYLFFYDFEKQKDEFIKQELPNLKTQLRRAARGGLTHLNVRFDHYYNDVVSFVVEEYLGLNCRKFDNNNYSEILWGEENPPKETQQNSEKKLKN